ncbi:cytochrome c family protein [Pseudomonas cavernae]|uniref:Cytochrome c family protein n=2 Tax=Pseudomonas cavernae TaxID=2320867 RepID=A0A385Z013_9PSED|nr:cytochrome c family protein [Pseudomonas cavernae]
MGRGTILWMCMFIASTFLLIEPSMAQDAKSGSAVFKQRCAACHAIEPGVSSAMGPSLVGVVGRKSGSLSGFAYSNAMKNSGVVWGEAELELFIQNPQKFVKGTKMYAPGISDAGVRADLITYLGSLE